MAKSKRKRKKGYVYLLKSMTQEGVYKYGCTTLTPEKRCKRINAIKKNYDFSVLAYFRSSDCYSDENKMKWNLLPSAMSAFGEIFKLEICEPITEEQVIERFKKLAGFLEA